MTANISRRSALKVVGLGTASLAVATTAGARAARASSGTTLLRKALGSKVLLPGDPGYDAECASLNTLVQQYPLAIVAAQTADDVAVAVRIGARELGWPVGVQSTGHGISVPADCALLINTSAMNAVTVNPARGTATIEGGARWSDVLTASAPLGLLPPVPSTSHVGATGYATGGGLSIIGRSYGYAADRVRSVELVTPDGQQRHLSPWHEPDLFWAVRGGQSNFGVVTSFEADLLPAATVYGGRLIFPAAAVEQVFRTYVAWAATAPDLMTTGATFVQIPGAPQVLQLQIAYVGPAADGANEIAPLRALNPIADTVTEVPAAQIDTIYNAPVASGAAAGDSRLLLPLDDAGIDLLLENVGFGAALPAGTVEFRQLGGEFAQPPAVANPLGYRDASFLLFLNNPVADPSLLASIEEAEAATMETLASILTGGTTPTFLGAFDRSPAVVRTAYDPAAWTGLLAIKHRYDPDNQFRINHNIR